MTGVEPDGFEGRAADPADTGYAQTDEQAAAFRSPRRATLLGYADATNGLAESYLTTAPGTDLGRVVTSPTSGDTHAVQERLAGHLHDSLAHLGQIGLLLGPFAGPAA
ncbi:hypothetical protein GA0115240_11904 [Streptomyces sp. DvalAA-14]|uniref:hypothetical protein n=1 Tax=unclassified Streptomyces TaxID=2593676 RepID=UPI00081B0E1A|nr:MULTISPECIES: hypothetical protein [unclassified Streptomyces]MYS20342.1 hypothetical protein [Streptomyces sp. SID4948]SCD66836.1 hypothetical protein GA0115240_11904 [Streptomyces sp. DvalAA-14]